MKATTRLTAAVLGGASLLALPLAAQAEDLGSLKAQLEALQNRVNQLEARPAAPNLPEGSSWITFKRGSHAEQVKAITRGVDYDRLPTDRGFTIGITPAADLPAPVHEVTISGYVKGDVIYDFSEDLGRTFGFELGRTTGADQTSEHVRLHADQTRFRINSRSDTAIGQIRTLIEGDFFGANAFRLRHAWGEWDMTPMWTLGVGQTWSNLMPLYDLADTIDFHGPAGGTFIRRGQVRLTYHAGPTTVSFAIEDPGQRRHYDGVDRTANMAPDPADGVRARVPDFTGALRYDAPGGHIFSVHGLVGQNRIDGDADTFYTGSDSQLRWHVLGAARINLADVATWTTSGGYARGTSWLVLGDLAGTAANVTGPAASPDIDGRQFWHVVTNVNVPLSDTLALNAAYGRLQFRNSDTLAADDQTRHVQTVHVNLMWQPVRQMRMGIEGMWGERRRQAAAVEPGEQRKPDAWRAQFGAWFFF